MNKLKTLARAAALTALAFFLGSASTFGSDIYTIYFASGGQVVRNGGLIGPPAGACGIRVTSLDGYEWRQTIAYPSNGTLISGSNSPGFSNILVEMTFLPTCSAYDQDAVVVFGGADQMPPAGANVIVAQGDGTWVDSNGDAIGGGGGGGGIQLPDFDLTIERHMVDWIHVDRLTGQIQSSLLKTKRSPMHLRDSDVEGDLQQTLQLFDEAEGAFASWEVSQQRLADLLSKTPLGPFQQRVADILDSIQAARARAEASLAGSRDSAERALANQVGSLAGSVAQDISTSESEAFGLVAMVSDMGGQLAELRLLATTGSSGK